MMRSLCWIGIKICFTGTENPFNRIPKSVKQKSPKSLFSDTGIKKLTLVKKKWVIANISYNS